jgi:serine/threonine protein kinase
MTFADALNDPKIRDALEQWDAKREDEGSEAARLFLDSLTEELRAAVESAIARMLAAEAKVRAHLNTCIAQQEGDLLAAGVPGRYTIRGRIAAGGMGIVYEALDEELDRIVAYKVMRSRYAHDNEALERFRREAQATSQLQYPGIAPVYGLVTDGSGLPAYAMEFIEGPTLAESIKQLHMSNSKHGTVTWQNTRNRLLRHFIVACRVVGYAHKQRYVHGDLKPSNILIDKDEGTRVVDWGICRFVSPDSTLPSGTPGASVDGISRRIVSEYFHGPSALLGKEPTYQSDVYALGATLQMLLTGGPPANGSQPTSKPVVQMPPPLAAVCERAMRADEQLRFQTPQAIADAVELFLKDEPNLVYHDPLRTRLRRWTVRHSAAAAGLLFTFAFLCIGAVVVTQQNARFREEVVRKDAEHAKETYIAREKAIIENHLLQQSALRNESRIKFEAERSVLNKSVTMGNLEYFVRNKDKAAELYEEVIKIAEPRQYSAFADDTDRLLLAESYLHRGVAETPGYIGPSKLGSPFIENLVRALIANGPLTAVKNAMNQTAAMRAEQWFDKAAKTYDLLSDPRRLTATERKYRLCSLLGRATMRLQIGHCTEALMDWESLLVMGKGELHPSQAMVERVVRIAAEEEQYRLPWSRSSPPDHAKATRMADYLANHPGVSDAAIYNAACALSLASRDPLTGSAEQNARAVRAVTYLRRIKDRGFFRGERRKKQCDELCNTDHDLDPIRQHPDFGRLKAQVESGE